MADASVRPASADDAAAVAKVQAAAWSQTFDGVLPAEVLADLDSPAAVAAWAEAAAHPPTGRHVVLVALAGHEVVGFTAAAPAPDPDLDEEDVEVLAFCVDPGSLGAGHGSRLVNALADTLRERGVARVTFWLTVREPELQRFLESAGWAPDGATRALDLHGDGSVVLAQERLVAVLDRPA